MPHIALMECQLKLAGYTIVTVTIPELTYLWTSGKKYLWMLVLKKCVKDLGFRIEWSKKKSLSALFLCAQKQNISQMLHFI